MAKIAVFGESESIKGFAALGMDIYPCENPAEGAVTLRKLAENDYGVIFITEQLAGALTREIEKYNETPVPAIIPIPGAAGNNGLGVARLKAAVEQAVGSDIVFNK